MLALVSKWGNSLGVRIPLIVAKQLDLHAGEKIEFIVEDDHILIQKTNKLEALLKQITPDNIHSEIETGSAGKEVW